MFIVKITLKKSFMLKIKSNLLMYGFLTTFLTNCNCTFFKNCLKNSKSNFKCMYSTKEIILGIHYKLKIYVLKNKRTERTKENFQKKYILL